MGARQPDIGLTPLGCGHKLTTISFNPPIFLACSVSWCVCVRVYVCARARVRACVRACMSMCVKAKIPASYMSQGLPQTDVLIFVLSDASDSCADGLGPPGTEIGRAHNTRTLMCTHARSRARARTHTHTHAHTRARTHTHIYETGSHWHTQHTAPLMKPPTGPSWGTSSCVRNTTSLT